MLDESSSAFTDADLVWAPGADPGLVSGANEIVDEITGRGLVVHNRAGAIVAANDLACELLGVSRDELFERTSHDDRWSAVSAEGLPIAGRLHPAMRALATGEVVRDFLLGVAVQTGEAPQVTRWLQISAFPVPSRGVEGDAAGPAGSVAAFIDASETDAGRAATASLLDNYRVLAENATDIVFRLDPDNTLLWVSPSVESVLGWRPEQLLGTQAVELAHPDDLQALEAWRAQNVDRSLAQPMEMRCRSADGHFRWMSVQWRGVVGADGVVTGVVVGVRDIHEQVLVREALAASEKRYRLLA
ncbi:MAG: PAS domain S-box protein, partial [Actinomycetes bacterium]